MARRSSLMLKKLFMFLCVVPVFSPIAAGAVSEGQFIIGTGSLTGVYYPAGNAICYEFNKIAREEDSWCVAGVTGGSVINIDNVLSGKSQFGIAQADALWRAINEEGHTNLRILAALHGEMLVFAVPQDSAIKNFRDLWSQRLVLRLNLGKKGSGTEKTVRALFQACGIPVKAIKVVHEDGEKGVDGSFFMAGQPNTTLQNKAQSGGIRLISLNEPCVDDFVKRWPYYEKTKIPGGLYSGVPEVTKTFGVRAYLFSSIRAPDHLVTQVVQRLCDGIEGVSDAYLALRRLSQKGLAREGVGMIHHPMAEKFYQEKEQEKEGHQPGLE